MGSIQISSNKKSHRGHHRDGVGGIPIIPRSARPNRKHSLRNLCLPAYTGQGYWIAGRHWNPFFPLRIEVDRTLILDPL
jgi:hypothetical protein